MIFTSIDPDNNHFKSLNYDCNSCKYFSIDEFHNNVKTENDELSIFNFNIRSFFKNFDELSIILSHFDVSFDIIILTETWLNENTAQLCNINGYKSYHTYRTSREGGGVSIFFKHNINSEDLDINIIDDNMECVGIKIWNNKKIIHYLF